MDVHISATELARSVGEVLRRIRLYRDSFVVERNGEPVARITPVRWSGGATLAEVFEAWRMAAPADPTFADDLDRVKQAD